jgi:hypothetical protein
MRIVREPFRFTPGAAWLRRLAGIARRRGQVWTRVDGQEETVVVIGSPEPADNWHGTNKPGVWLANLFSTLSRSGWCHQVFCLETGKHYYLNELYFAESEQGLPSIWGRIV